MLSRLMTVAFLCCSISASPPPASAQQRDLPPLERRRMAERHAVVLRIDDRFGETQAWGTGMIVAEEGAQGEMGGRFIIATARHVVAAVETEDARVKVLPHKHIVWLDAELLLLGDAETEGAKGDYAFLALQRDQTEFVHGALIRSFSRSPTVGLERGEELWALGFDSTYEELRWAPCKLEEAGADYLSFSSREVRQGYSGGMLVHRLGAIGMTISIGNRGKGCGSLTFDRLARASVESQTPFGLREPVLAEAFRACLEFGVLASICEMPRNRWIALAVDRETTLGFEGRWVSYGPDNNPSSTGKGARWTAKVAGGAIELELLAPEKGRSTDYPLTIHGMQRFVASTDVEVSGHVLLASKGVDVTTYLAVPQRACETVGVRYIASAATPDLSTSRPTPHPFVDDIRVLGGKRVPFMFALPTMRTFNNNKPYHLDFLLRDEWVGLPITLAGRLLGSDEVESQSGKRRDVWERQPVDVYGFRADSVLAQISRSAESPNDFSFTIEFEPTGPQCRLQVEQLDSSLQGKEVPGLVLQAPVLLVGDR